MGIGDDDGLVRGMDGERSEQGLVEDFFHRAIVLIPGGHDSVQGEVAGGILEKPGLYRCEFQFFQQRKGKQFVKYGDQLGIFNRGKTPDLVGVNHDRLHGLVGDHRCGGAGAGHHAHFPENVPGPTVSGDQLAPFSRLRWEKARVFKRSAIIFCCSSLGSIMAPPRKWK